MERHPIIHCFCFYLVNPCDNEINLMRFSIISWTLLQSLFPVLKLTKLNGLLFSFKLFSLQNLIFLVRNGDKIRKVSRYLSREYIQLSWDILNRLMEMKYWAFHSNKKKQTIKQIYVKIYQIIKGSKNEMNANSCDWLKT